MRDVSGVEDTIISDRIVKKYSFSTFEQHMYYVCFLPTRNYLKNMNENVDKTLNIIIEFYKINIQNKY